MMHLRYHARRNQTLIGARGVFSSNLTVSVASYIVHVCICGTHISTLAWHAEFANTARNLELKRQAQSQQQKVTMGI